MLATSPWPLEKTFLIIVVTAVLECGLDQSCEPQEQLDSGALFMAWPPPRTLTKYMSCF